MAEEVVWPDPATPSSTRPRPRPHPCREYKDAAGPGPGLGRGRPQESGPTFHETQPRWVYGGANTPRPAPGDDGPREWGTDPLSRRRTSTGPGQTLWWCSRCGMSWRAARIAPTCTDGCAQMAGTYQSGQQSWLRHRQLVIEKRSPEYQALRSAGLAGAGTATPRIDHPCPGREWGRWYHAWRKNLHRWVAIVLALFAPTFPQGEGPRS